MKDPQHQQEEQQSEEAMRQAFEQFMIAGSGAGGGHNNNNGGGGGSKQHPTKKKKKKKKGNQEFQKDNHGPDTDNMSHHDTLLLEESKQRKDMAYKLKVEKKAWQIIQSFQGVLQRHWIDVDDNLENVISSIANLRHRIHVESQYLLKMTTMMSQNEKDTSKDWWKNSSKNETLNQDDVQLALDYDLLQHEKMMAGTRTLLSSLSEAQDMLGRRLEELMVLIQYDYDALIADSNFTTTTTTTTTTTDMVPPTTNNTLQTALDTMNDLFIMLAMELHRKQCLVQTVLDSSTDDIMAMTDDNDKDEEWDGEVTTPSLSYPQKVADKATRTWSRSNTYTSAIDMNTLQTVLDLGDRSRQEEKNQSRH